ncbi:MAG: ATP-dependent helicase [Deltaproteobacteria bacterium]|nr:ATP-dependent helicase [Deltaproteobacteria bacterium]
MDFTSDLNPEQKEAVLADEPYILVNAGPGTGKTHTLIRRIARLAGEPSSPKASIVVLTFTRKAAEELKSRLSGVMADAPETLQNIWAGTIHARCVHLLRQDHEKKQGEFSYSVLDRENQLELVRMLLESGVMPACEATGTEVLNAFSSAKNGCLDGEPFAGWREALEIYQKTLKRMKVLDYDDLLIEALELPDYEASTPAHVLIDEYQDVNPLQHRLVRKWVADTGRLFAIGDADQSIYGFRGADTGRFLRFENEYPGARVLRLTMNYRCVATIAEAAGSVIRHNKERVSSVIRAHREQGEPLRCVEVDDERAEADFIARDIERLIGGTHSLGVRRLQTGGEDSESEFHFGDVAVLFRTHALAQPIRKALEQAGFPWKEAARDPLYESDSCRGAWSLVRFCSNPSDDLALSSWIRCRWGAPAKALLSALRRGALETEMNIEAVLSSYIPHTTAQESILGPLREELVVLSEDFERRTMAELLNRIGNLLNVDSRSEAFYAWEHLTQRATSLDPAPARESARDFLDFFNLKNPSERFYERSEAVFLLTLHAAKGLEFPVVYVVGLEEDLLPYKKEGEVTDIEEERRLFYVGMTRASDRLVLTRCENRVVWGRRRSSKPSRFLSELDPSLVVLERVRKKPAPKKQRQKTLW